MLRHITLRDRKFIPAVGNNLYNLICIQNGVWVGFVFVLIFFPISLHQLFLLKISASTNHCPQVGNLLGIIFIDGI